MFPPAPCIDLSLFLIFIFNCVSVCGFVPVSAVPSEAGEGTGSQRAGVTSGCELLGVDMGN